MEKLLFVYLVTEELSIKLNKIIIKGDDYLNEKYLKSLEFFEIEEDDLENIVDKKEFFRTKYNNKKNCINDNIGWFNEFLSVMIEELTKKGPRQVLIRKIRKN